MINSQGDNVAGWLNTMSVGCVVFLLRTRMVSMALPTCLTCWFYPLNVFSRFSTALRSKQTYWKASQSAREADLCSITPGFIPSVWRNWKWNETFRLLGTLVALDLRKAAVEEKGTFVLGVKIKKCSFYLIKLRRKKLVLIQISRLMLFSPRFSRFSWWMVLHLL